MFFFWFFDDCVVDFELKIVFVVGLRDLFYFENRVGYKSFVFEFDFVIIFVVKDSI